MLFGEAHYGLGKLGRHVIGREPGASSGSDDSIPTLASSGTGRDS